jgi:23S rRNA (guanine2445-N2)-methyltransferase / 23S rRNA (guanine2069-N7)-methyltransferase
VVVNPPYGERLGSQNAVPYLYRCLGRKLRNGVPGWRAGVLSAHRELTAELRMNPVERYSLYNGPLPCELQVFAIPQATSRALGRWKPVGEVSSEGSEDFGNRLRKNMKRLEKWVEKEHILCYRIYDGDIPEYNVSVDFYEQWIHVQEYAPPKTVDPLKAAARLKQVVRTLQDVLKVGSERIFLKVRSRQKGKSQYQKQDEIGRFFEVREGPCRFLVNLSDYLDAGLFLDHRNARTMIREGAKGTRFLNLFGYTGSATVHAAMGGAKSSVTVDTSPVYLEWARRNLALNGFGEENHRFVQADCSLWLSTTREQFDLIFLDPPTFSNSRRLNRVFDVAEDHPGLIRSAMKRLEHDGTLIFSTNFRRFKLDPGISSEFQTEEITPLTIPPDFERSPHIHRCWRLRRAS